MKIEKGIVFEKLKSFFKYFVKDILPVFLGALFALMFTNSSNERNNEKAETLLLHKIKNELAVSDSLMLKEHGKQENLVEYSKKLIAIYDSAKYKDLHSDSLFYMLTRVLSYYDINPIPIGNGGVDLNLLKDTDLKILIANHTTEINAGFPNRDMHRNILTAMYNDIAVFWAKYSMFDNENNSVYPCKSRELNQADINKLFSNDVFFGRVKLKAVYDGNLLEYQDSIMKHNYIIRSKIDQILNERK